MGFWFAGEFGRLKGNPYAGQGAPGIAAYQCDGRSCLFRFAVVILEQTAKPFAALSLTR